MFAALLSLIVAGNLWHVAHVAESRTARPRCPLFVCMRAPPRRTTYITQRRCSNEGRCKGQKAERHACSGAARYDTANVHLYTQPADREAEASTLSHAHPHASRGFEMGRQPNNRCGAAHAHPPPHKQVQPSMNALEYTAHVQPTSADTSLDRDASSPGTVCNSVDAHRSEQASPPSPRESVDKQRCARHKQPPSVGGQSEQPSGRSAGGARAVRIDNTPWLHGTPAAHAASLTQRVHCQEHPAHTQDCPHAHIHTPRTASRRRQERRA